MAKDRVFDHSINSPVSVLVLAEYGLWLHTFGKELQQTFSVSPPYWVWRALMGRDDNIAALPSSVEEMLSLSESVVVGTIKERITEPARGFARECEAQARGPALAGNDLITAGLINSHKFSRDCLIKAIEGLDTELNVVPFGSIKDCIGSDLKRIDLVIYHHHSVRELEGTTANGMTAIREALPDIPLLVLSDAEDAEQLDALRSALSSGVHGFIPTRTTGISVTVAAIRFSRLLPSTDACAGSKVRTIIDEA